MDANIVSGVISVKPMTMNEYQQGTKATNMPTVIYVARPTEITRTSEQHVFNGTNIHRVEEIHALYNTLGMVGEAGEFAEKVKKHARDGVWNREDAAKELGDVLWYLARIADDMGYTLEEIARLNQQKLADRKARGVMRGSGDNR